MSIFLACLNTSSNWSSFCSYKLTNRYFKSAARSLISRSSSRVSYFCANSSVPICMRFLRIKQGHILWKNVTYFYSSLRRAYFSLAIALEWKMLINKKKPSNIIRKDKSIIPYINQFDFVVVGACFLTPIEYRFYSVVGWMNWDEFGQVWLWGSTLTIM